MGATMRITYLLLSLSLFCHKARSDNTTAVTGVTVAKNPPTEGVIATPVKAETVAKISTIQTGVEPDTDKPQTLATTTGDAGKVTQATTALPAVTLPRVNTAPTTKVTAAPIPPHQQKTDSPVDAGASSTPPTVKSATLASIITTVTSKATLPVTTVGSTQAPTQSKKNLDVVTGAPTSKVSTVGTTANHQPVTQTVVVVKTTQQDVKAVTTTAMSPQQQTATSGTTKATVREQTTTKSPILPSTAPSVTVTTSATPGATSTEIITTTTKTAPAYPKKFSYSLNNGQEKEEEKDLVEVCRRLMGNLKDGNCTLTWRHHKGKLVFDCVEINGKVKTALATQYYEEITKPTDNKTLIAILASCGALLIMIIILAVCASHHRKPYSENQQHLTEELHTVENGYHDNPTLEVMEVQPEMQEKKLVLNGEFNDGGWIVPIDNLLKEDVPDEEDTHL
ncbi:podocalyxin isoform X2 [Hippocampus comes]|uniref:podocalyxin isoform X2 n=1 Tax=Hippocampus comes TaxID=109280 RepID=UPI00094F102D|nr:PREDICTED: podocalyxin isoform X2 [Hippocampus comes]